MAISSVRVHFDQINDLSDCSFTLIIISSHRHWARKDGLSKIKGGLPPSEQIVTVIVDKLIRTTCVFVNKLSIVFFRRL